MWIQYAWDWPLLIKLIKSSWRYLILLPILKNLKYPGRVIGHWASVFGEIPIILAASFLEHKIHTGSAAVDLVESDDMVSLLKIFEGSI